MHWKKTASAAGILLVAAALWCLWLWQPERQVLRHNASLVRAFGKRDWKKAERLIDGKFADRWGHDRERVLRESREILRQFFAVEIAQESVTAFVDGGMGCVRARIRIRGSGTPIAQLAMQTVNGVQAPFRFDWAQKSWKPWDWALVRVDNPQLELPRGGGGFY
jgi:hypothetical protein